MAIDVMDRAARFAMDHQKALAIAAGVWFWASMAVYARFVDLPDMPNWIRAWFFWTGAAFNAGWWGFVHPRLERRKQALAETKED